MHWVNIQLPAQRISYPAPACNQCEFPRPRTSLECANQHLACEAMQQSIFVSWCSFHSHCDMDHVSYKTLTQNNGVPFLVDCKPRLLKFFFLIILCGLQSRAGYIFFISLRYQKLQITLSLPWLCFFQSNSLFTFHSLQHHGRIRHRRDYDEQKAGVVVKYHYQGYEQTRNVQAGGESISAA